jgi:peptidoglycan/xylan/chitin deacetylase (PgdA/CDA1 family)
MIMVAAASLMQAAASSGTPRVSLKPRAALTPELTPAPYEPEVVPVVPSGRPTVRVPILMYHYIRVNPDPRDRVGYNLSVTPDDFSRQMDWLEVNGYHPVTLEDLRGYVLGGSGLPSRPVVLTFDDGYRDLYSTAFPVLLRHQFKSVAYIVPGFLGSPSNVTADQVLEMEANGVEIGSHTVSHADLTRLSAGDLHREVFDSKAMLEALVGHPVLDFCYPAGRFNDAVVKAVEAAGYLSATTTQPGTAHSAGDRFMWTRVRVSGGEPLERLVADLGPSEDTEIVARPPAPVLYGHGQPRLPFTVPLRARPTAPPEALRVPRTTMP